ncbi:MAG: hypothetical protein V4537_18065 [Pseudomonadota bacterium]
MTVAYTSYKASATFAALTMLSGSATFRTLVGAATPTLALAKIVEEWGGTPKLAGGEGKAIASDNSAFTATPPYAIVRVPEIQTELIGVGFYRYHGEVDILVFQARKLTGETPPESMRRATNIADAIRDEITAQFGATSCFATGSCSIIGPGLPDDAGADADALQAHLTITFEG